MTIGGDAKIEGTIVEATKFYSGVVSGYAFIGELADVGCPGRQQEQTSTCPRNRDAEQAGG